MVRRLSYNEIIKYKKCPNCGKYSLIKKYKDEYEKKTNIENTYTDAGYGYNDRYGEVEYVYHYLVCPNCGDKKVIYKNYIRTIWEKSKNEL